MVYKWCIVPQCKNTSIKTPQKVFISVPSNAKLRQKWLKLAQITKDSNSSCSFYCEDHFNMEKDVANYMQYKMGYSKKIKMADGALPSKFDCQHNFNNMTDPDTSQTAFVKTRRNYQERIQVNMESNNQNTKKQIKSEDTMKCQHLCIEDRFQTVQVNIEPTSNLEDDKKLLEVEFIQIKVEPNNDIDVDDTTPKSMSLNKETIECLVKQEPLDVNECPVYPGDNNRLVEIELVPSELVQVGPNKNIDGEDTALLKPGASISASKLSTDRKQPKTAAQRNREYRQRKKLSQGGTTVSSNAKTPAERSKEYRKRKKLKQTAACSNAKSDSQRCKEYRERKKMSGQTAALARKRSLEFRFRLKLKQLKQLSTNTTKNDIEIISDINKTALEVSLEDCNQGKTNKHNLDILPESQFANDQKPIYSNYDQHCSGHIDFFNNFKNNAFGCSCAVCDRLWWQRDLKTTSSTHDNILQVIVPNYVIGSTVQVCSSCKAALDKQKIPILSTFNGFTYPTLPTHLPALDLVSQQLISPRIPFMQIRRLRHVHKQDGIYGQVINVPLSINTMVKQLPRNMDDDHCMYVNIERKLMHKSSNVHGLINKKKIKEWLIYLVETPLYIHHNVTIDDILLNIDDDDDDTEINIDDISEHIPIEESLTAQQQTLMWNEGQMLHMTAGMKRANNTPINIFEEYAEELSFPTIYGGQFRKYNDEIHVTSFMQVNSELRRTDRRGAHPQHLLYMAMKIIRERVKSSVADAFKYAGVNVTKEQIQSESYINNCIETNLVFLRCVPNSASYWADRKKDLFAIIRQKGAPSAFMTLTANETGWDDLLKLLYRLKNNGEDCSDELLTEMSYIHKAALVNEDAVTCAIYYNKLLNCLLHTLQAKKRSPFCRYRVLDYFRRIEFLDRGSPQAHIFLWLDNAPENVLSNDADVIEMIDQLVSVSASEASRNINFQNQKHTSCKKPDSRKMINCRFKAPFMPSRQTVALLPMADTDEDFILYKDHYKCIQSNLENIDYNDFNDFYTHNNIESDLHYNNILRAGINRPKLFYKRTLSEIWHNPFNPFVFHHLESNMNFQIIEDEYACAAYIVEYFNTNKNISNLQQHIIEIIDVNPEFDLAEITRELSVDILNSVEMSTQEAAWYLLREPMAKSSITIVYIPTVHPIERQKRKTIKDFNEIDEDYVDIWKENWFDSYETRPEYLKDVSLAQFVSKYCKNNKGDYSERKEPRVIRYRNYDMAENFNDYRREMVLLHIPFRNEDNDILANNRFIQLYEENKDLILQRRKEFATSDIANLLEICRQLCTHAEDERLQNENNASCDFLGYL